MAKDTVGSVRDGYSQIMSAITVTMTAPDATPSDIAFLGKLQASTLAKIHIGPANQMAGMGAGQAPQGGPPQGGPPGGAPPPQAGPPGMASAPGQGLFPNSPTPNTDELRALMTRQSGP